MERGPFQGEEQAMACIAKLLKVSPEALQRDRVAQASAKHEVRGPRSLAHGPPTQYVSKYRFVTRRVMRGSTYWVGEAGKR